jgi:hypothetical protein
VHQTLDCAACHSSGVYSGLPSECSDCHIDDYNSAVEPDHVAAGFPTTCDSCHSNSDLTWNEATYPHAVWPLVGAHAMQPCSTCHTSNVYAGLPSECVDCHIDDYNASTNPNHTAAGYPTFCEICHRASDLSWNDGVFDHVAFPISGGPHGSRDCSDCHPDPTNFMVFSCTSGPCHPQMRTVNDHSAVAGFIYESAACYSCHPDGRSDKMSTGFGVSRASH